MKKSTQKSNHELEDVKNFRKSLSGIVETCLEKYTHKSIWNFRNNINDLIEYSGYTTKIVEEARYLIKRNPSLIDDIIEEMNDWYTGVHKDSHENYDEALVMIFTEEVTAIYVNVLGRTYSAVKRLKAYENNRLPMQEQDGFKE